MITAHIRWMIRNDMPAVMAIERESFGVSVWSEADFARVLRQRNSIGMVAEYHGDVLGFMVYQLLKSSLSIVNFAVAEKYRRCELGRQMVAKLAGKLSPERRNRITVMVNEGNLPGQLFFRSCGFIATSVHRAFYEDTGEDGYSMRLTLSNRCLALPLAREVGS